MELTTEQIIEKLDNPNTAYYRLVVLEEFLFRRAEQGDRLALVWYLKD